VPNNLQTFPAPPAPPLATAEPGCRARKGPRGCLPPVSLTRWGDHRFDVPTQEPDPEAEPRAEPSHAAWPLLSALSVLAQARSRRAVFKYRSALQSSPHHRDQRKVSLLGAVKGFLFFFSLSLAFLFRTAASLSWQRNLRVNFVRMRSGEDEGRGTVQKTGRGETLQGFTSFLAARCRPTKAGSVPQRTLAPRKGAWVPTRERGCPPVSARAAGRRPGGFSRDGGSCRRVRM